MSEPQTETNGTATVEKSNALKASIAAFEARKEPAKPEEISKALAGYLKIDDEIRDLQDQIEKKKVARTEATKKLVSLRGMGRIKSKAKCVPGQIIARGENAWIAFQLAAEGGEY